MLDLLPKLSFGDNLRPGQVTTKLRRELAELERHARNQLLIGPLILVALINLTLFGSLQGEVRRFMPWSGLLGWQGGGLGLLWLFLFWFYSRRIRFCEEATVTTAAVMEKSTITLWGLGAGRSSLMGPSPRNVREALNFEDEGRDEDVPRIVTLRLRFVPGFPKETLGWDALRDDAPHCDVTKRVRGGGWGTFAGELKQGSLVALLYAQDNPKRCRIVQRFRSHQRMAPASG